MPLQPRVTDISHHNTVTDLRATANAGVWGVIHKATQGTGFRDKTYPQRRPLARAAGMLWGAYHFGDSSDPVQQVNNFLDYAKPDASTFLSLDYEDHPQGRTMRPQQMVAFLREIERRTGRKALLYGGNRIKEDMAKLNAADRAYVASHLLWLCQYGPTPKLPQGFSGMFLWQYTDGVVGPQPRTIPGIQGHVDLNAFSGTRADLEAAWFNPVAANTDTNEWSSQSRRGADDDDGSTPPPVPRGADDDTGGLPPFLRASQPSNGGLNVQPQRAAYSLETEMLQTKLIGRGYHEIGEPPDGKWGGKTRGGVTAFMNDRGRSPDGLTTDYGFVSPDARSVVTSELSRAIQEGWSRPIAPDRANATPKDLAPRVETVKISLWGRFSAKIAAGFAALGFGSSSVSNTFSEVRYKLAPVQDFFSSIPTPVWFLLMGIVAVAVWYFTDRAAKAATKDYNTGRLN